MSCTSVFFKSNSQLQWHFVGQAALYQDNNPKHTPRKASKWSQQNKVNIRKWSAQPLFNALLSVCGNTPGKGSVFMRSLLLVHMSFGVCEGGIGESTKGVCRNLIKSMPRRMEVMIRAKECQTKCKQKNCPI